MMHTYEIITIKQLTFPSHKRVLLFKIYSLIQIYNTIWLLMGTVLYISAPEFIHLIAGYL